jgi:enoyl-CoA hydratase
MTAAETIGYEKFPETHTAIIQFNRPEKLNAFTLDMYRAVAAAIQDVNQDDDLKVVILRGDKRSFSSGQDLNEVGFMYGMGTSSAGPDARRPSQRRRLVVDREWAQHYATIAQCQKIVIAEIEGYCLGTGFEFFLSADLTVVAEDAILGHPGRRLVGPGLGFNTFAWFWKLGPALAKYMAITGNTITGAEARDLGLTFHCVPADKVRETAEELAGQIALLPGDGIVMGKASFQLAADIAGLAQGYSYGYIMHTLGTNVRFDEDEHNFFRERREKGARDAFHERDERFLRTKQP